MSFLSSFFCSMETVHILIAKIFATLWLQLKVSSTLYIGSVDIQIYCAVLADPYLGSRAFYFGDVAARMELANAGNYLESLNAYFTCGRQKGFNDLHPSTSHLAGHLLNHYDAPLFIGVTHDLNCASP